MHGRRLFVCDEHDPHRCTAQGKDGTGQCNFLSLAGMCVAGHVEDTDPDFVPSSEIKLCPKHGAHMINQKHRAAYHDYQLQVWQRRVSEFAESDQVKSLRGEIGILRMIIETVLNMCNNNQELMIYSTKIADLVIKCEKLVTRCESIENKSSMLMDKSAALAYGGKVIDIIGRHVDDPEVIEKISNDLIDALKETLG